MKCIHINVGRIKNEKRKCINFLYYRRESVSGLWLPDNATAKQIVHMLNEQQIYVDDASRMFLPEYKKENILRLCISQVHES